MRRSEPGQVLIIVALALVVLLGATAFTVDLGRRGAEERYLQNAADAAALAACNALVDGATNSTALATARAIAATNLANSPSGSGATIAGAGAEEYVAGFSGNPYQLTNGAVIADDSVFVAIDADVSTTVGKVLGRDSLAALGRARCATEADPALPFVIRRYQNPPGPGGGFIDFVATAATSASGAVDATDPRGYGGRTPASAATPGPVFEMYGPGTQATNNSFRGFIALDVRDFTHATSRQYYNGATPTMSANTLKGHHAAYITTGYPGPAIPAVQNPPGGATQVGILNGVSAAHSTAPFDTQYSVGDKVMFAVYNGTVMAIPDFSIRPPIEIRVPATTTSPAAGPSFEVSRNAAFTSSVDFTLMGDSGAAATGHPEYDILPNPTTTSPATGTMGAATFTPDNFVPATRGTNVAISGLRTNAVPEGIYTVWIEGDAGAPYFQTRRQPVPVRVGTVDRDFSLAGSVLDGATTTLGGTITLGLRVSTRSGPNAWDGGSGTATPVQLSWDTTSLTDCSFNPKPLGTASIGFSPSSVTPSTGVGTASTLTIQSGSLSSGCYLIRIRAQGVNGDGEPVVRSEHVQFTVAGTAGPSEYVDVIGFAVFEITDIRSNSFSGRAITGVYADPDDLALRAAQRARLIPWN
jgi:Putative Flp pilus-assembly TadE/G-like